MTAETAIRSFQRVPNAFVRPARTTVIGWNFSSVASARPKTNSPQAPRKLTTETVIRPGVLIGNATRQNAVNSLHPSILAASTISPGTRSEEHTSELQSRGQLV